MASRDLSLGPVWITAIKFLIGAIIILPPTILMGGTLPILSKFMTRSASIRGKIVARLYYINSFGAVIGAVLAGFYFIYRFGLERSIVLAALINLSIGAVVILLRMLYKKAPQAELLPREESSPEYFSEKIVKISLGAIFLSGFTAMLYEIVWIRMLSTILGSSTYSFSLMLAAFISGITIGSFLISRHMPQTKRTFLFFGLCEILIGIGLIFSLPFYERLPFFFLRLSGIFARTPETFVFYSAIKFLLSFLVMLLPTIFLGMTLPLVSKIVSRKLEFLGKKVGSVFAFNTTGNIMGALVSGLILLPVLGLKHTLEFGIAINLLIGFIILSADKNLFLRGKIYLVSACCVVFLTYKIIIPDWNQVYFSAQLFRHDGDTKDTFRKFSKKLKSKKNIFYEDGPEATVSVMKTGDALVLYINGKADASTTKSDMSTQILAAELPLILKPDIKDVFVVGLGSGVTCGSALLHPVENLDLVEISPSVVDAAEYFARFNYNALHDKRLHLYIEDARTFVQRIDKKYDLIISEPSNPWVSGNGTLFTVEYFWDCLNSLKEDGLMIQWV
ncbi:MAG: fused MFS/spermidine synthase [Candidatus Gorgyraea atricola]|nr:fused MFS/spermidine synthase [Candidatus Gorgyraea atricola]